MVSLARAETPATFPACIAVNVLFLWCVLLDVFICIENHCVYCAVYIIPTEGYPKTAVG